jgi:maltooligosyltrehalose trehalohydrolase
VTTKESIPPADDDWGDEDAAPTTRRTSLGAMPGAGFPTHGARVLLDGSGTVFRIYAPTRAAIDLVLYEKDVAPPKESKRVRMSKGRDGYHVATVRAVFAGTLYAFSPDGEGPFPDVASRFQPFGVHGPSEVVSLSTLQWTDQPRGDGTSSRRWRGRALEDLVIYELHVGTATPEGTFRALIDKLDHIAALGATAIELMPIADFDGDRNWGYDGVALFAPARCYGRPEDLGALVDAAHARGLAVILDVVYNHLGPSGAYLGTFAPSYFTKKHKTPWGDALDYGNEALRVLLLENAEQWIRDYHIDGLRLDATHAVLDDSERHVLSAIADCARACASEREVLVIAEDERNDAKLVRPSARGGVGLDAVWADDFHHELRRILTGDDEGYFGDFKGTLFELLKILQKGWLYEGQPSKHLGKPRGTPVFEVEPPRLVVCIQNHDQIGNRARGDRLNHQIAPAVFRAATAMLLSLPFTPLLFMGEEFGASSPFCYFTDHEPSLGKLVTEGRRAEFAHFRDFQGEDARARIPDPQAIETFQRSKLDWAEAERSPGKELVALHRALLSLRRKEPAMKAWRRGDIDVVQVDEGIISIRRRASRPEDQPLLFVIALTIGGEVRLGEVDATAPRPGQSWKVVLDTEERRFGGNGNATLIGRKLVLKGPGAVVLRG